MPKDMPNMTATKSNPNPVNCDAVRPEIVEIVSDVFQFDGEISLQTSQQDLEKWDSLRHVALVAALERRFGISLSMDEMMEIISISDVHRVLDRHGV